MPSKKELSDTKIYFQGKLWATNIIENIAMMLYTQTKQLKTTTKQNRQTNKNRAPRRGKRAILYIPDPSSTRFQDSYLESIWKKNVKTLGISIEPYDVKIDGTMPGKP